MMIPSLIVECFIYHITCRGSSICMAILNASKVFDKINHNSLFLILMKCNILYFFKSHYELAFAFERYG